MQRLTAVNPAEATGKAKQLLDGVQAKLGITPNMMKTMAASPAVLEGYLSLSGALAAGSLDAKVREEIALTVAQANSCEYCLAAHSAIGKMVGLEADEILASRESRSADAKQEAALKFAQTLVVQRGEVSDQSINHLKAAGFTDGQIGEIVANVALNLFTNYYNHVARTTVDFPKVAVSLPAAAHS